MREVTVIQSDKSEFKFKVGDIVKLVSEPILGYMKKDKPMRVESISKDSIRFRDTVKGGGTFERICMLDCMKFEKVA